MHFLALSVIRSSALFIAGEIASCELYSVSTGRGSIQAIWLTWATRMALAKNVLIQVFSIRPESKEAKLLFEVSKEGIRPIPSGNYARILKGAKWVTL